MRACHRVGSGIPRWAPREKRVPGGLLAGCVRRAVPRGSVCAGLLGITQAGCEAGMLGGYPQQCKSNLICLSLDH